MVRRIRPQRADRMGPFEVRSGGAVRRVMRKVWGARTLSCCPSSVSRHSSVQCWMPVTLGLRCGRSCPVPGDRMAERERCDGEKAEQGGRWGG